MQLSILKNRFLKDNSYLLLLSLLLLSISIFTKKKSREGSATTAYAKKLQDHIQDGERRLNTIIVDTALTGKLVSGKQTEEETHALSTSAPYIFIYKNTEGFNQLTFWSTQTIIPDEYIFSSAATTGFRKLMNGYYFFKKIKTGNNTIVGLLPVKWNYFLATDYLKNDFAVAASEGQQFEISFAKANAAVRSGDGTFLFSVTPAGGAENRSENMLTVWLRLLSLIPLFLFIHFAASHIQLKRGVVPATVFLAGTLLLLRLISYVFPVPVSLRQFELFDPSVYGSDIVLRSLGDLLINAVLFFWIINFIKNHLKKNQPQLREVSDLKKWLLLTAGVIIIVFVTYTGSGIIRSMVADSQISFDVINFFSLNLYSVIGFVVLCCIAIGYYYFCRIILFFLRQLFPGFMLPMFLSVAIAGLILLSFRIGDLSNGFELYELIWLLLFLLLIKNDLSGFFASGLIISRMVFWLFFFSASIAVVIITENSIKEVRNRLHYAELIAAKTDPISEVLLNTMLTEFRPELLAERFDEFTGETTAGPFRDSLVNNNFTGYTDKYDTKVLVYDSAENALYNEDPISFNSINSIYNTQASRTSVAGLYYYNSGYDKFSYISKKPVRNYDNHLLGYLFILISPKDFNNETLFPDLFSRGTENAIENSSVYAFAIYDKGKLLSSHNDYAFSTRYPEIFFAGKQFLSVKKQKYNELWYNAGSDKFVVIVKENKVLIELITLFSYLFCAFLLLSAISWLISSVIRSRFSFSRLRNSMQLTIRQQVHGTVILFSVLSFIIIGMATILFFISRYENNNRETLSRTIRVMQKELSASVTKDMIQSTILQNAQSSAPTALEKTVTDLSLIHGLDVNVYSSTGDLKASSLALPYIKGVVSTKADPLAFFHLGRGREIQYFQKEHIGNLNFVSDYIPVTDSSGQEIAYLNIPYFTSQTRLKEEISNFLVTIINLNAFIFLIAGMVALIITNRITRSFSFISDKMKLINLGSHNEAIEWRRNDEIGALVKEYNRMLAKLEASAAALARTERESAWQEMAKQVAHEIKNPLTPMKLSMQFLQKSIQNDAPNIKELSAKVSATLVEQIDHLANIAGEFSRFANIEKSNPELFNLNEALLSLKQLHIADTNNQFTWKLLAEEVIILADKTHINRILTNLILNGLQAVPAGIKPLITVTEKRNEETVEIKITDNGSGISEEVKQKIFTPNFTTKSSGTGLGLAMCKRMVEQAGGTISYETSEAGTSFFVTLPLAENK